MCTSVMMLLLFIYPPNIPLSVTKPSYKPSIYITHASECPICYSNLLVLFFALS